MRSFSRLAFGGLPCLVTTLFVVQARHNSDPFTLQSAKVVVHAKASFKQLWARLIANPSPSIALLLDRLHVPLRRSPLAYSIAFLCARICRVISLVVLDLYERGMVDMPAPQPKASVHNRRPGPGSTSHRVSIRDGMAPHRTCSQLGASISTFLQPEEKAVSADKLCVQARH
ncbi:hypothetical protein HDV63DRAFT_61942 [Trichoderma sp. SZMC 28014]